MKGTLENLTEQLVEMLSDESRILKIVIEPVKSLLYYLARRGYLASPKLPQLVNIADSSHTKPSLCWRLAEVEQILKCRPHRDVIAGPAEDADSIHYIRPVPDDNIPKLVSYSA